MTRLPGIRPAAVPAWDRLRLALLDSGPVPCSADPDAWFSDDGDVREYAARECWRRCPIRAACNDFGDANRESHGVFGGIDRTPEVGRPGRPKKTTTMKETA